jgi:hypothetical protein
MKLITLLCNVIFFLFLILVVITDGVPKETFYVVFTLLSFLIPVFNVAVILTCCKNMKWFVFSGFKQSLYQTGTTEQRVNMSTGLKIAAIVLNILWFVKTIWIYVKEYPHPNEPGFALFAVLMLFTPVLSIVLFSLSKTKMKTPESGI